MTYAVISDIHANLEALDAVLADIDRAAVDQIVCLGDLIGYMADPAACIQRIASRSITTVRGNHDAVAAGICRPSGFTSTAAHAIRWTVAQLDRPSRQLLGEWPLLREIDGRFLAVHGALHPAPNENMRINNVADAIRSFDLMVRCWPGMQVCFFGHTHHAGAFCRYGWGVERLRDAVLHLCEGRRYLINPGSVGQPRDGDIRASYVTFDADNGTVRWHRVRYQRRAALRKAISAGLMPAPTLLQRSRGWLRRRIRAGKRLLKV